MSRCSTSTRMPESGLCFPITDRELDNRIDPGRDRTLEPVDITADPLGWESVIAIGVESTLRHENFRLLAQESLPDARGPSARPPSAVRTLLESALWDSISASAWRGRSGAIRDCTDVVSRRPPGDRALIPPRRMPTHGTPGESRFAAGARLLRLLPLALLLTTPVADAQTREYLDARAVSRVRVRWDPGLAGLVATASGDDQFKALSVSPPFLTQDALAVTYPRLNPLRVEVTAAPRDAAGVSGSVMTRLRALLALSAVMVPLAREAASPATGASGASEDSCGAPLTARADAAALTSRLWVTQSSETLAARVSSWRRSVDDAFGAGLDGPVAISAAVALIDQFVTQLDTHLVESDHILARIAAETARTTSAQPCETSARAVYLVIDLANPRARMAALTGVRAAARLLRDSLLRGYGATEKWHDGDYRLADIRPTRESSSRVTIRVTQLQFDVDESTGALVGMEEATGSETLIAQRFSRFGREFAVASVISSVTRPGYGTTTNEDGATVVGRLPRPAVSDGARFSRELRLPMPDRTLAGSDAPGWYRHLQRCPRTSRWRRHPPIGLPKGDVAIGGGGIIAWVKDLRTLHVGDRVGGTSDIEADLRVRQSLRVVRRVAV